ncbi:MAG: folate family ECF transporter S component [Clostridiales bacterium]|nr:folate family ECF transporter S component [Clostridiales bacterium]
MKKSTTITVMGLTIALNIILSRFIVFSPAPFVRIGISFIAVAVGSILFGPIIGGVGAAVADVLGYFLFPTGGYIPGITISAFLIGVIYGMILYKKQPSIVRSLIASLVTGLIIEGTLTSYWLYIAISGHTFWAIFLPRIIVQLLFVPIKTFLIYLMWIELGRLNLSYLSKKQGTDVAASK